MENQKDQNQGFRKVVRFDEKEGILYSKITGVGTLDDMLKSLDKLAHDKVLPRNLRYIEDARDAKSMFSNSDLTLIAEKIKIAARNFVSIRHAVVHSDPKDTAYAMLLQEMISVDNYHLKVFSTLEFAKEWII